jgi:hypothetical protein
MGPPTLWNKLPGNNKLLKAIQLCWTEEESSMLMLSSVIKVCNMCGFSGARGSTGLVGMRQLILSKGLTWMEVRILAQRAPTLSKRFYFIVHHTYVEYCFCG